MFHIFMHIIKEAMGVYAYSYVLALRIGKVAELLLSGEMSVTQVAYETFFRSALFQPHIHEALRLIPRDVQKYRRP